MSKTQHFEAASAHPWRAPFDVPCRTPANEEVPCVISLAEIAAAFEGAEAKPEIRAPGSNTSDFRHPPSDFQRHPTSDFQRPLGVLASWRFASSFAPGERLSLRSLRHRLHVRAQEILAAAQGLLIAPQWCHDAASGCVIATVTLPEAEKIAEAILFSDESGEAADPNYQPSTLNHQLRLKLPGRLYIVQLDPKEKPLRVKVGFTTNLEKRLRAFRCIAPDARYFAHWPAEDFWEKTATASITVNCRHLGGEVYEAQSLADLRTRAEAFLALLPKPPTTPRFIPIPPRRPRLFRFTEDPLPLLNLNRNLNHNLREAAQPPQTTTREDAHVLEGRRIRASVFQKALGGAEAPPSPNFRRGKAAGGAEQTVAAQIIVETPVAPSLRGAPQEHRHTIETPPARTAPENFIANPAPSCPKHEIVSSPIRLPLLAATLCLTAQAAPRDHPPIPVPFTLTTPGFVTLVIEDPSGHRVRNLISETEFPAGPQTAWWDGLDDLGRDTDAASHAVYHVPGKFVAPGQYRVRGLVRPKLDVVYEMTPYTNGNPPWRTKDPGSEWLANHTAPSGMLFVPKGEAPARPGKPASAEGQVLVGSFVSEGGSGLAWLDLDGHKLNGQLWLGGVWTGASHLARDTGPQRNPEVYAYAGAGWRGDKYNEFKAELRLHELVRPDAKGKAPNDHRFGSGEDRPVLTPTFKVPKAVDANDELEAASKSGEDINPLGGLAVYNQLLVASIPKRDLLVFIDAKSHALLGTASFRKPRGLAFDHEGRLLVVSETSLFRVLLNPEFSTTQPPPPAKAPSVPPTPRTGGFQPPGAVAPSTEAAPDVTFREVSKLVTGLEDPQQITLDAEGQVYVSDWGQSHQVKVFTPAGKPVRTIGLAGAPAVGPYERFQMRHPAGLSIDDRGRLWVAETDKAPKRISVWRLDGKFEQAFYGPPAYGGGGWLDTEDLTRFFYSDEGGGLELKLDWEHGSSVPVAVFDRPELDQTGLRGRYVGASPQTPLHHGRLTYLTNAYNNNPTGGSSSAIISLLENGVARPVAAAGDIHHAAGQLLPAFEREDLRALFPVGVNPEKDKLLFVWSDLSGDGKIQPNEITFTRPPAETIKGQTLVGGVSVLPDFSFALAYFGDRAVRFAPREFLPNGVPVYEPQKPEILALGVQRTASSGGGQVLAFHDGRTVLTNAPAPFSNYGPGGGRQRKPLWSYPSLWPGLHASHISPMPEQPGELIGTTRLLGNPVTPRGSDAGELWAVNGNKGNVYLFTSDGLFVATLFKDSRTAAWDAPEAKRGLSVADLSLQEESFWPTISQRSDGKIYLVGNGNILRLDGLEDIRRLPESSVQVSPAQLSEAQGYFTRAEASRQAADAPRQLTIALRSGAPAVDGKLDDWRDAQWALIDERMTQVGDWGRRKIKTEAALAIAGGKLFAAFRTDSPNLANSGESLQNLFKTGAALDLMIGAPDADPQRRAPASGDQRLLVTRVKNKTVAVLYRQVAPGAPTPKVQFSSPLRTVLFDRVDDVSDQVTLATGSEKDEKAKTESAIFELSIPLSILNLKPVAGQTLRGDLGLLRGNGVQTLQRIYWSNKASGIVSDIPSEAELTPHLWGTWTIK